MNRREFFGLSASGSLVLPEIASVLREQAASPGPIDCNCMIGPSNHITNAYEKVEGLLAELDYYGIGEVLAYHSYSRFVDAERGNDLVGRIARQSLRVRPCWVIYPSPAELPNPEEFVETMQAKGIRTLRIFPGQRDPNTFGLPVRKWNFGPLLAALERHRVSLLVERPLLSWEDIYDLATTYKHLPLIILAAHFGESRNIYALLKDCPNVHFGMSHFLLFNGLEDVVRWFGAERLLFDSGLPEREPSMVLPIIYFSGIRNEDKNLILRGNFERLWGNAYGG